MTDRDGHPGASTALLDWPSEADNLDFSPEPEVTPQDVLAALGPDADELMRQANVDVEELIRLINAETTMLPPIVLPTDAAPAAAAHSVSSEPQAAAAGEDGEDGFVSAIKTWKKRFLRGTVLAVMITLTGGGAAALAMNKSVTVDVDGELQTVRSYGDTVGEVLEDAGIAVGTHDALSPSPQAQVGDGGVIKLERGRQFTLVVDGESRDSWVRATTVREALSQLGLNHLSTGGTWFSAPLSGEVPLDGMRLEVKTEKTITLFDGGEDPREVTTNAVTAEELLAELKIGLGKQDKVEEGADFTLTDGAEVHVNRTGESVVKKTETIEPEVETIYDDELPKGDEVVEDEGKPGEKIVTYQVTKENGEVVDREELSSEVVTEAEDRVVRVGTKEPDVPAIGDGAVWDSLAQCESTGNWSINTGNGYYGGLQFNKQTWDAYGGSQYAAYPHEASREQQIAIATKLRDARGGYGAWPHCSSQLGLPQ
ncbi:resuscitation-promoting factor [Saccharomonospora piscinae]|uniref:resuscitation-promoting factor n=1 Tax=Saccharomonospora piscinae TaxID=687388 RepID=UPI0004B3BFC0|nr:resuscitation-promoting factor [Saccharomonospora piscinae]